MMREKLKDKAIGFYFTAGAAVLCLITAVVCIATPFVRVYSKEWMPVVVSLIAFVIAGALIVVPTIFLNNKRNETLTLALKLMIKAAPWVILGLMLIVLIPFGSSAYSWIAASSTGKTPSEIIDMILSSGIPADAIFLILSAAIATAAICLCPFKTNKETVAEQNASPSGSVSEEVAVVQDVSTAEEMQENGKENNKIVEGDVL